MMTRKHFEAIAGAIKAQRGVYQTVVDDAVAERLVALAENLADFMAGENQDFDRDRFLAATGM